MDASASLVSIVPVAPKREKKQKKQQKLRKNATGDDTNVSSEPQASQTAQSSSSARDQEQEQDTVPAQVVAESLPPPEPEVVDPLLEQEIKPEVPPKEKSVKSTKSILDPPEDTPISPPEAEPRAASTMSGAQNTGRAPSRAATSVHSGVVGGHNSIQSDRDIRPVGRQTSLDISLRSYVSEAAAQKHHMSGQDVQSVNLLCTLARVMFTCRDPKLDYITMHRVVEMWMRGAYVEEPMFVPPPTDINVEEALPPNGEYSRHIPHQDFHGLSEWVQYMMGTDGCVELGHLEALIGTAQAMHVSGPQGIYEGVHFTYMDAVLIYFRFLLWTVDAELELCTAEKAFSADRWLYSLSELTRRVLPEEPEDEQYPLGKDVLVQGLVAVAQFRSKVAAAPAEFPDVPRKQPQSRGKLRKNVEYDHGGIPTITSLFTSICQMAKGKKDPYEYLGGTFPLVLVHLAFLPHRQDRILSIRDQPNIARAVWPWLNQAARNVNSLVHPAAFEICQGKNQLSGLLSDINIADRMQSVIWTEADALTKFRRWKSGTKKPVSSVPNSPYGHVA